MSTKLSTIRKLFTDVASLCLFPAIPSSKMTAESRKKARLLKMRHRHGSLHMVGFDLVSFPRHLANRFPSLRHIVAYPNQYAWNYSWQPPAIPRSKILSQVPSRGMSTNAGLAFWPMLAPLDTGSFSKARLPILRLPTRTNMCKS